MKKQNFFGLLSHYIKRFSRFSLLFCVINGILALSVYFLLMPYLMSMEDGPLVPVVVKNDQWMEDNVEESAEDWEDDLTSKLTPNPVLKPNGKTHKNSIKTGPKTPLNLPKKQPSKKPALSNALVKKPLDSRHFSLWKNWFFGSLQSEKPGKKTAPKSSPPPLKNPPAKPVKIVKNGPIKRPKLVTPHKIAKGRPIKAKKNEKSAKKPPKIDPVLLLRPLLEKGMVIWLKDRSPGQKTFQCVIYSLLDAPYKKVLKKMTDYANLKNELPNMAVSKVVDRKDNYIDVYYELEIPGPNISYTQRHIFHKDGSIEVIPLKGLKGHWLWTPHKIDGGKRTIMVYESNTDISQQGWLLRQLLKHQPAIRRAINSSGAIFSMSALHNKFKRGPSGGKKLRLKALLPYLKKGTLSLIKDKKVSGIHPLITYCLVKAPREKVWEVALDFENYSKFVPQLYKSEILDFGEDYQDIQFTVHFPLVRFAYTLRYFIGDYSFKVRSLKGVSGTYSWKFYSAKKQCIIKYSALANIRHIGIWNSFLQRRPDLEKALNLSISQITLTGMRKYIEKGQK